MASPETQPFAVWNGVYNSFADAPAQGSGFSGETWSSRTYEQADAEKQSLESDDAEIEAVRFKQYLLAPIAATLLDSNACLRVIDFGGGMGNGYVAMRATLRGDAQLDYHIVELLEVCAKAQDLFGPEEGPVFHRDFPTAENRFDLAHVGSALQYADDWRDVLAKLAGYQPSFILLSDLLAGDIETFVTLQYYYGDLIPMRFFCMDEVMRAMDDLGYTMVFQAPYARRILGSDGALPMDNFPPERRIDYARHVLFKALDDRP